MLREVRDHQGRATLRGRLKELPAAQPTNWTRVLLQALSLAGPPLAWGGVEDRDTVEGNSVKRREWANDVAPGWDPSWRRPTDVC